MDESLGQVFKRSCLPVTILSWVVFVSCYTGTLSSQSSTLCLQYYDHDENVVSRIQCPSYYNATKMGFDIEFCCGDCFHRYCCKEPKKVMDQDRCNNHLNPKTTYLPVGLIVACLIGGLAMVVGCFLFASFYESCLCFKGRGMKERRMRRPPPVHRGRRKVRELRYERPPGPDITVPRFALPAMHPDVEANTNCEQYNNHSNNFQETAPLFPLTIVSPPSDESIDNVKNEGEKEKHKSRKMKAKEPEDDTIRLTELPADDIHDEPDHPVQAPVDSERDSRQQSQQIQQSPENQNQNQERSPHDEGPPPYEQVTDPQSQRRPSSPILSVL